MPEPPGTPSWRILRTAPTAATGRGSPRGARRGVARGCRYGPSRARCFEKRPARHSRARGSRTFSSRAPAPGTIVHGRPPRTAASAAGARRVRSLQGLGTKPANGRPTTCKQATPRDKARQRCWLSRCSVITRNEGLEIDPSGSVLIPPVGTMGRGQGFFFCCFSASSMALRKSSTAGTEGEFKAPFRAQRQAAERSKGEPTWPW